MKYTSNLALKKPELNEFYNVEDFNENMDILDQKLGEQASVEDATFDTKGIVQLTDSEAVTDSTGLALPATEKNASIVGTLAYKIQECFQNVSDFKQAVAEALTNKGVATDANATRDEFVANIGAIKPILLGAYTGDQTLDLSALGKPDATTDDFLVAITSIPSAERTEYYVALSTSGNTDYYHRVGSVGSTPTWEVSGGNLVVSGMYTTAYWKNLYGGNNITVNGSQQDYEWNLYYIGA